MPDFHVFECEIPKIVSDSENLMGFEFVARRYWTLEALMGYLKSPFLRTFHAISEQLSLATLIFNIQARSEDERVPAEYDNCYQLERPNRPTRIHDRPSDLPDRPGRFSESLLYL